MSTAAIANSTMRSSAARHHDPTARTFHLATDAQGNLRPVMAGLDPANQPCRRWIHEAGLRRHNGEQAQRYDLYRRDEQAIYTCSSAQKWARQRIHPQIRPQDARLVRGISVDR